jgi:thioredoxin:protein disulfide reductase
LQTPWVLALFATLLVLLSLSMFDVYTLQLPASWRRRLNNSSNRLPGGRFIGVFMMGGLSALIVSPCIAAPLAGALVYISQTHDVWLGGVALFSLACGMSLPLLLLGLSFGSLVPRAGAWMTYVKDFFGFLLLAVALWMLYPVLAPWAIMCLSALWLLAVAIYLVEVHDHARGLGRCIRWSMATLMALVAAGQVLGALSGGQSLWQPLAHLRPSPSAAPHLNFQAVRSLQDLDQQIKQSTQPVMLDIYADWCVSCREFEAFTLSDERVQKKLTTITLLRFDITAMNEQDQALLRRYGLFGPPALLFFNPQGPELSHHRVIGFQSAAQFLAHLDRVWRP